MLRHPSPTVRGALLATAFALAVADAAPAQAIGQGFELERTGRADQAAELYLATVRASPTDVAALLGLERVLIGHGEIAQSVHHVLEHVGETRQSRNSSACRCAHARVIFSPPQNGMSIRDTDWKRLIQQQVT